MKRTPTTPTDFSDFPADVAPPLPLIPTDRLGTGVADGTTFLRGDGTWAAGGGGGGGNEEAQDAVGTILVDSNTLDFTYNDATPSISADARTQMSITSDASGLKLSGDSSTPGASKLYGTDSGGTKGWYSQPSGSGLTYLQVLSAAYLT